MSAVCHKVQAEIVHQDRDGNIKSFENTEIPIRSQEEENRWLRFFQQD